MGSNYFGEPNLGNERYGGTGSSSSSSSSSRKRKKKKKTSGNISDQQPKQPQRGLGVAQLEKIRLHTQMAVAASYNIHPNHPINFPNPQEDTRAGRPYYSSSLSSPSSFSYTSTIPSLTSYGFDAPQTIKMMGKDETEKTYVSYGESHPSLNTRWNAGRNTVPGVQHTQPMLITRQLLDLKAEEATGKNKKARGDAVGSGSAVSGSSSSQQLDLELRLSL